MPVPNHPPPAKVKWSTPYTPRETCTTATRNLKSARNFVALDLTTFTLNPGLHKLVQA